MCVLQFICLRAFWYVGAHYCVSAGCSLHSRMPFRWRQSHVCFSLRLNCCHTLVTVSVHLWSLPQVQTLCVFHSFALLSRIYSCRPSYRPGHCAHDHAVTQEFSMKEASYLSIGSCLLSLDISCTFSPLTLCNFTREDLISSVHTSQVTERV